MLERLAGWCYDRRRLVVAVWLLAVIAFSVAGQAAGGSLLKSFNLPGTESSKAFSILGRDFSRKGDTGELVFAVKGGGDVRDAEVRRAIEPVMAELRRQPHVESITSPYTPQGARFIAARGKIAYAEILFDVQANDVPLNVGADMRDIASKANTRRKRPQVWFSGEGRNHDG